MEKTNHAQLRAILLAHASQYPAMEPRDAIKLIYQNEFGGGHLVQDENQSLVRLKEEFSRISRCEAAPRLEEIGNGLVRVMLPALDVSEYPLVQLNEDFVRSSRMHCGTMEALEEKLSLLSELVLQGQFSFSSAALEEELVRYRKAGCPPISHSAAYRAAYSPAYRVIRKDALSYCPSHKNPADAIWSAALPLLAEKARILVAIDGRCAAGKSTLAEELRRQYNCCVIHMDHFFLRPEQRTPQRYQTPGENIDHERFLEEVLLPLNAGKLPVYRPFNCTTQSLDPSLRLSDRPVVVVEGSYSCHPALREHYDLRVFLSVDPELQMERILARNGEAYAQVFREKWIPLEEQYFSRCGIEDCYSLNFDSLA